MKITRKYILWSIVLVLAVGAALAGSIMSNVEQAKYTVVESYGAIEIRDYAPMIVAETEVSGERKKVINQGFRVIADYIFGNNAPAEEVAMTAPVMQSSGDKIAMTAPVIQQGSDNSWKVRFVMPAGYTMGSLPKPNNPAVLLKKVDDKRVVAIRFSGMGSNENLRKNEEKLEAFVRQKKLVTKSSPTYAFYNPPWTLPFMRRNEVLVEIAK